MQFVYDASGAKLRKIVLENGVVKETRDYVNGVEYKDRALERVAHSEGAVVRNDHGQYQHEYVLRDHLGNTRVTFRDGVNKGEPYWDWSNYTYHAPDNTGYDDGIVTKDDIVQINHYYPFGLNMEGDWNGAPGKNKYQYNGKEWNDDFGLGWNDYGARFYDPSIARWSTIDPLSEKYLPISPYVYVANNPIKHIDPDGKRIVIVGTPEFRKVALMNLQKLTNDKLVMSKDGTVHIMKLGTENKGKDLKNGTKLIQSLNDKSDKANKISIQATTGGNRTITTGSGENAENGKGTGSSILFNDKKTEAGVDVTGSRSRPTQIGLGHELIHASHMNKGVLDGSPSSTTDPDNGRKGGLDQEEINTRKEENLLRKEQGVPDRQIPK